MCDHSLTTLFHSIANIKSRLESCHSSLKEVRSLCQCHSDEDQTEANKKLETNEEALNKLKDKIDKIQLIKCIDVEVKRLPSNWRATLIRVQRERARELKEKEDRERKQREREDRERDGKEGEDNGEGQQMRDATNDGNDGQNEGNQLNEPMIGSEADEISNQFEKDLERKIYETQVEELMQLIQQLVMKTKTMRSRIDISKQLIKSVLKYKRELEASNSVLKESMATCHCAEAGAPEDQELQNRLQEKRRLEDCVQRVGQELKHWEEEYSLLKENQNKNKENEKAEVNRAQAAVIQPPMTTTVVEVANEEVVHDYSTMGQMASTQSCMFAGQSQHSGHGGHGMASMASQGMHCLI